MTRILAGAAAVAAALLLVPSPSSATSFNCRLATLPAELLICNDGRLGALDEEMARQYYLLINTAPPDAALQITGEQRAWIRGRNLCGFDRICVRNAYRHRIQQLGAWSDLLDRAPPFGRFAGPPPGYGPFAGPPYGPPPGFYDDGPPGPYGDDDEIVPFDDPDGGYEYYFDDDGNLYE